jgi:uncharacterized membrane protein YkgB
MIINLKIILGYMLFVISLIVMFFIISGWKDCKYDTENIFTNILLFLGYTWDLLSIFILATIFGIMLVTKII